MKFEPTNYTQALPHDSKAAICQIGWLGQSGETYAMGTPLEEIHAKEPGSYQPLYIQIGTWEYNETSKKWFVEQD
jgi:hypothetical protein